MLEWKLAGWLADWLAGWLLAGFFCCSAGLETGWLAGWPRWLTSLDWKLAGWLAGWLACWTADWLPAGSLAGLRVWLAHCLHFSTFRTFRLSADRRGVSTLALNPQF